MPHIDYDYYDYLDEQDDKNRRRQRPVILLRVGFAVFIAVIFACGFVSLFYSCE